MNQKQNDRRREQTGGYHVSGGEGRDAMEVGIS